MRLSRGINPRASLSRNVPASQFAQRGPREALLQHLDHNPGIGSFRLAEQQMNVLRHDHITDYHEAITLPYLFKDKKKEIAPLRSMQKRESVITAERDEVQKSLSVAAIESRHRRSLSRKPVRRM
jgi:hypothetical protein